MKRRGHGEGTIYKRSEGRWAGVITVDGKRVFRYGKTRQEAQRKMAEAQREVEAGLPLASEQQTVEQFLHSWLEMIKPTIEESTWIRHRNYCDLHIIPKVGKVKLAKLT